MLLRMPIRAVALLLGAGAPVWCAAQYVPPAQIQVNTPQPFGYSGRPGTADRQMQTPTVPMRLPDTPATSAPAPPPPASAPVAMAAPMTNVDGAAPIVTKTPAHRAKVVYADGRLTIDAENSSLNQILHEISMQSGIKISGGVVDERVFGAVWAGYAGADPGGAAGRHEQQHAVSGERRKLYGGAGADAAGGWADTAESQCGFAA